MIPAEANRFYAELQQDRAWWQAHREQYHDVVELPLRALLEAARFRYAGSSPSAREVSEHAAIPGRLELTAARSSRSPSSGAMAIERPPRLTRRLVQLFAGLVLYGFSMALMIESHLGNMPWDVLHEGIVEQTGLAFGLVVILVSAVVLLAWVPLREKPGFGTVSNVLVVAATIGPALAVVPRPDDLPAQLSMAVAGVVLNGVATAAYIGVAFGPGPRDGLMTGLVRRTGGSIRLIRTAIEVAVVVTGWLLGGTLGVITALYALAIGPLAQLFLPPLTVKVPARTS